MTMESYCHQIVLCENTSLHLAVNQEIKRNKHWFRLVCFELDLKLLYLHEKKCLHLFHAKYSMLI